MSNRVHVACTSLFVADNGTIDVSGKGYVGGVAITLKNGASLLASGGDACSEPFLPGCATGLPAR